MEGIPGGDISRAHLEHTYRLEVESACHKWMKLKTSKAALWIENLPDQIKEENLSKFTMETESGARMDPIKMINVDMHLL